MKIRKNDKWKVAFQTRYGYFKYQVMLFNLFNASASFKSYVNKVSVEKHDIFIIIYLDDILIYTKNTG